MEDNNEDIKNFKRTTEDTHTIFYYDKDGKKVVYKRIKCESDSEAIEIVGKLRSGGYSNEDGLKDVYPSNIYWEPYCPINVLGKDGKIAEHYESFDEEIAAINKELDERPIYLKVWGFLCDTCYFLKDQYYRLKNAIARMRYGYDDLVSFNVNSSIIDLIVTNVPKMVKNLSGCPGTYIAKGRKVLHPEMSDKEIEEMWNNGSDTTNEEMNVSMALWKADLENLVENCKLYTYYESFGCIEPGSKYWVDPNKYPIPNMLYSNAKDYRKIEELKKEALSKVFDFMKENFEVLWD